MYGLLLGKPIELGWLLALTHTTWMCSLENDNEVLCKHFFKIRRWVTRDLTSCDAKHHPLQLTPTKLKQLLHGITGDDILRIVHQHFSILTG